MAEALFARTALPCKENSSFYEIDLSNAQPREEILWAGRLANEEWRPTPRSVTIGDRAYVAGLSPAVPLDEIPDIPAQIKADLAQAWSSTDIRLETDDTSKPCRGPSVEDERGDVAKPEDRSSGSVHTRSEKLGPVFDSEEIAVSRALFRLLDGRRFVLVGETGVMTDDGRRARPALCRKLAAIGMVAATPVNGSLLVRRSRPADGSPGRR